MERNSMDTTNKELKEHLILGKQKTWKKILEWFFTILGWLIILTFVGYVIYGNLAIRFGWALPEFLFLNREMLEEVDGYYVIILIVFLVGLLLFFVWKSYNKRRFGSLRRRKFRPDVTNEELQEKFGIDDELLYHLQHDRVIILEENIIPEKMGMGQTDAPRE